MMISDPRVRERGTSAIYIHIYISFRDRPTIRPIRYASSTSANDNSGFPKINGPAFIRGRISSMPETTRASGIDIILYPCFRRDLFSAFSARHFAFFYASAPWRITVGRRFSDFCNEYRSVPKMVVRNSFRRQTPGTIITNNAPPFRSIIYHTFFSYVRDDLVTFTGARISNVSKPNAITRATVGNENINGRTIRGRYGAVPEDTRTRLLVR